MNRKRRDICRTEDVDNGAEMMSPRTSTSEEGRLCERSQGCARIGLLFARCRDFGRSR